MPALQCSKQITFARIESDCVFNFGFFSRWEAFRGLDSQALPGISLKRRTASEARGFDIPRQPFTWAPTVEALCSSIRYRNDESKCRRVV